MAGLGDLSARRRVLGLGAAGRPMLFRSLRIDRRGVVGKEWTQAPRRAPTPAAGRIGLPRWPPSTLARTQHLASEGTRAWGPSAATCLALISQTRSAREMHGPSLARHAQASELEATGLSLCAHADTHRRRRESEGRFLRHQRLHGGGIDPRFPGGDGAIPSVGRRPSACAVLERRKVATAVSWQRGGSAGWARCASSAPETTKPAVAGFVAGQLGPEGPPTDQAEKAAA